MLIKLHNLTNLVAGHPPQPVFVDLQDKISRQKTAVPEIVKIYIYKTPRGLIMKNVSDIFPLPLFLLVIYVVCHLSATLGRIVHLSATPLGRIVLTTTPVCWPPMIPNPRPVPSLTREITSTWHQSDGSTASLNVNGIYAEKHEFTL